jgi:hypothetical protein
VRPETFNGIVNQIGGRMGISQQDVFEALRTVLMARRMESLLVGGVGFEGAPPGWRWDYYRRLEQGATIETVPLVVEKFVEKLPEPTEPALRAFFEKYKDELPAARSPDPGFRQPHRARYDYLVAKAGIGNISLNLSTKQLSFAASIPVMIAAIAATVAIVGTRDRVAGGSIVTVHAAAHSSMTCETLRRRFRAEPQPP